MPIPAQTNARPPPVQAAHILPTSPCPPTPKQLQLGQWGMESAPQSKKHPHPLTPPLRGGGGESLAQHLLGVLGIARGKGRGGKKRL